MLRYVAFNGRAEVNKKSKKSKFKQICRMATGKDIRQEQGEDIEDTRAAGEDVRMDNVTGVLRMGTY